MAFEGRLVRLWVSAVSCALLLCAGACATHEQRSAEARVRVERAADGSWRRTIVNQRFDGTSVRPPGTPPGGPPAELIVQQTLERRERSGLDDDVHLEARAYLDGPRRPARPAWTIVDHADHGRFHGEFFVTRLEPRGPWEYLDRYYALATGEFLFGSSDALRALDGRRFRSTRFLAYLFVAAPDPPPCAEPEDLGWLQLVSAEGRVLERVAIAYGGRLPKFNPEWSAAPDPAPLGEVRLALDGEPTQVRLPLRDGGFDLDGAILSEGFRVERRGCDPPLGRLAAKR